MKFRDVVKSGNTLKRELYDQVAEKKEMALRQKKAAEEMMQKRGQCCQKRDNTCSVHYKKFDLVQIENLAFNKLFV